MQLIRNNERLLNQRGAQEITRGNQTLKRERVGITIKSFAEGDELKKENTNNVEIEKN